MEDLSFNSTGDESAALEIISYTLACRRSHLKWRIAMQASTIGDLAKILGSETARLIRSKSNPSIGFVFTGQGAHWSGMGKELIDAYPIFRETLKQLDDILLDLGANWSIVEELRAETTSVRLDQAEISMPVCCALQIALVVLLRSWGITPSAVTGHSSGESAAAFAAGALDMRSALAIQYHRGRLTAAASRDKERAKGGMLAVGLGPSSIQPFVDKSDRGQVVIGCYNSPSNVTLSGDEGTIDQLDKLLQENSIFSRKLKVQSAFHSPQMLPDETEYRKLMESSVSTTSGPLSIPLVSSVTGDWITHCEDLGPEHWLRYMLDPVRFTDASTKLFTQRGPYDDPNTHSHKAVDVVVEIGPHSALGSSLRQTMQSLKLVDIVYMPVMKRSESAVLTTNELIGFLWSHGCPVKLQAFISKPTHHNHTAKFDLPSYPWNHSTHFEIQQADEFSYNHRSNTGNPLIGISQPFADPEAPCWTRKCSINGASWPHKLTIEDVPTSPQPYFLGMAAEAIRVQGAGLGDSECGASYAGIMFEKVQFHAYVSFSGTSDTVILRTSLQETLKPKHSTSGLSRRFQIHCIRYPSQWLLLCEGQVTAITSAEDLPTPSDVTLENKSRTNGITLHPGLFTDTTSQVSLAKVYIDPLFNGLHIEKRLPETKDVSLAEASDLSKGLTAAFQTVEWLEELHHLATAPRRIVGSLDQLLILFGTQTAPSSFYVSEAQRDVEGKVSVASMQVMSTQISDATASSPCIHIQGMTFDEAPTISRGTYADATDPIISRVHMSTLCHSLLNADNEEFDKVPRHELSEEERLALLNLNKLCKMYFLRTLSTLRKNPPRRLLGHFASYVQLMKSIESATSVKQQKGLSDDAEFARLRENVCASSVNGQLVSVVGDQMVALIRGEADPLEVMMKDRLLHRYYEEGLRWTRSYQQLEALLTMLSLENPRARVLEIGAGTGGATTSVLASLSSGSDIRCDSYTYTDISAGFFPKAREKFAKYAHVMDFKKLDIEKDLAVSGLENQEYDLIVASQCLHATANMRNTMANRVLEDTGFTGIDFTVKDCEDEELYAMRVILSTAAPEVPETDLDLRMIVGSQDCSATAKLMQDEITKAFSLESTSIDNSFPPGDHSSYLGIVYQDWPTSAVEKLNGLIAHSRGALIVSGLDQRSNGHLDEAILVLERELRSSGSGNPLVSLKVAPGLDLSSHRIRGAVSKIFMYCVAGQARDGRQRDSQYVLDSSGQLFVPRIAALPFPSLNLPKDPKSATTLQGQDCIIRGRSVSLLEAVCTMMASFGANHIEMILTSFDGHLESEMDNLRQFVANMKWDVQCTVTCMKAGPDHILLKGGIVVDFDQITESTDPEPRSAQTLTKAARDELTASMRDGTVQYIRFVPLRGVGLSKLRSVYDVYGTTIYTAPIATTDDSAQRLREECSVEPVEMHTIILLLAELLGKRPSLDGTVYYAGLPAGLSDSERSDLFVDPPFRSLAPHSFQNASANTSGLGSQGSAVGGASSLQLLPTMSTSEKVTVMCQGIVRYIADMFMLPAGEVEWDDPYTQFIDSLTGVQLRGWLETTFKAELAVEDISRCESIRALATRAVACI
ncbi:MAG: hypothetical protein Q9160_008219 [Pyrenula sp. 1 TL-2023]